jgi:phospholipid/cholesterol/gamma-HCH transport system substrate-binding protein
MLRSGATAPHRLRYVVNFAEVTAEGSGAARRVVAVGALVAAAIVIGFLLLGGSDPYTVKARFLNAGQLVEGNLVQTGGRKVGLVESIDLAPDGTAEVELSIDPLLGPLRQGTRATIRIASLSGVANRYVDLEMPPGEEQDLIASGGTIPLEDTTTVVDLDHLFSLFDERTKKGLRNVIEGFADSYEGEARAANEGWRYLNPSLVGAQRLFEELSYDREALQGFVVSNARLVNTVADRRGDVSKLVDRLAVTLDAIGRESDSLRTAISRLPPFMMRANSTFVNLRATLDDLDPLIEESRPVTPKLRAVLAELRPFAIDARPTVRDLSELVRSPGAHNDLIDLSEAVLPFRDVTVRRNRYNGELRDGSFVAGRKSLRAQTPQWAFQRPYAVDLTGWFDDFSHSGIYDAFGSASRVSTNVSAFAFANGQLELIPEAIRPQVFQEVATLGQRNRCPGSTERPAEDGSNPFQPSEDFNCDPTQIPPGP